MQRIAARCWGLPKGYVEQFPPSYYSDDVPAVGGITWQPDVYPYARDLALLAGITKILDVGCGHADKLALLHEERPDWGFTGVDWDTNLAWCRQRYDWGAWVQFDLEGPIPLSASDVVIICADVIEHLIDPRSLLRSLAGSGAPAIVLSTPDRALIYPPDHLGPPGNPCHVREWTGPELVALLEAHGLRVEHVQHTRSHDHSPAEETLLIVAVPA